MLAVYIFIVKSADYNYLPIDILSKQFGNNIPRYSVIENSSLHNPEYLFCVDQRVKVLDIIQENGFKLVTICESYVEEDNYNNDYMIEDRFYDIYNPYSLVRYENKNSNNSIKSEYK